MTPQQIEHCIIEDLPDAVIDVELKRGATILRVVSQKFAGRGQSERQRHVLSLLKQGLANGSLRISHLKLYSHDEWAVLKPTEKILLIQRNGSWPASS